MRLLPTILAATLLAPAAAAHDHGFFPFDPFRAPREMGRLMRDARFELPRVRVVAPRVAIDVGAGCRPAPVHEHAWRCVDERQWVAPLFQDVLVGYDRCGRPLFEHALVRGGYWTTVRYQVCDCGVRVRC
jgi:hypothetical protein